MLFTIAALTLGTPVDDKLATLSRKIVSASDSVGDTMKCSIHGDPHISTFEGTRCDLYGLGLFPLVSLPGFVAQGFHCPPPLQEKGDTGAFQNLKPSFLAGTALKIGKDTVTLVGHTVMANGQTVDDGKTTAGDLTIDINTKVTPLGSKHPGLKKTFVMVTSPINGYSAHLVTIDANENLATATGWTQNFRANSNNQTVDGYCASACNVKMGGRIASVEQQNAAPLLSPADLDLLHQSCGTTSDDAIFCEPEPTACNVCNAAGISCDEAYTECKAACGCADDEGLSQCQFDYCQYKGEVAALESCVEAYCPPNASSTTAR
jgi:hypothetical protein